MSNPLEVLVIGGAVLDIVYSASDPSTTASCMAGTSTPCSLARLTLGGVGRNVAEALARLGIKVQLRTVVGGAPSESTVSQQADTNGVAILQGMAAITRQCPNLIFTPHIVSGATTATYMAILDAKGELASAAAIMGIFEKHFTVEVAVPKEPLSHLPSPKWVVVDGNLPQQTLEGVCRYYSTRNPKPLIAYDPISKEKVLRSLDCLPMINLMKPNNYEAIALAVALAARGQRPALSDDSNALEAAFTGVDALKSELSRLAIVADGFQDAPMSHLASYVTTSTVSPHNSISALHNIAKLVITKYNSSKSQSSAMGMGPLWAAYEHLSVKDQERLALMATIYILHEGKVGHVLCTIGKGGCWSVKHAGNRTNDYLVRRIPSIPIPPPDLAKVTGAGDSFLSGYLYGLLRGDSQRPDCQRGSGWQYPERCATLAATSALTSRHHTISPAIKQIVDGCKGKL